MKCRVYSFLLVCFCVVVANAQYSRLFTVEEGLSSNLINNLYQDSRGCIWISTGYGLNRYDGVKFVKYKSFKNDSTSLLSNNVYSVYEKADGKIFVISANGLQLYDYESDCFHTLVHTNERYNNKCLLEQKNGTILVGTSGYGIKKISIGNDYDALVEAFSDKYSGYNINSLLEDNDGNLWIATENEGLIKLSPDGKELRYNHVDDITFYSVNGCTIDSYGNVYISSVGKGVFIYDKLSDSFKTVYLTRYPVMSILQYRGVMLIGTDGGGIATYDIRTKETGKADFLISDINLAEAKVHSIVADSYDNLWIGVLQKGVAFIPDKINKFNYIGCRSTLKNNIGDKCVTAVGCSDNGYLFVGTDNDGLYVLNDNYDLVAHLSPRVPSCNAPNTVMCMLNDSNGNMWVGSYLEGLAYLENGERNFNYISFDKSGFHNVNKIYALAEDKNKRLWVGTMGGGLYYIDLSEPEVVKDSFEVKGKKVRPNENLNLWINCLFYGEGNMLYIGTVDGIRCLDLNAGRYTMSLSVLKGHSVSAISQDINGNVWVGTIEGIKVFNKTLDRVIAEYDTNDGLPDNNIASITSDIAGDMWISTNRGIAKYEIQTNVFIPFRTSDGLYNNEFFRGAFYNSIDGKIYFGGTSGIVYFNPDEIRVEPIDCNLRITAFYLHNKPVNETTKSGKYNILHQYIMDEKEVELSYRDNSFVIEFAADNFSKPHDFEYSMNGKQWNSLQPGTSSVSFSNLPVGKYNFMVRYKNAVTESSTRVLGIRIHPAWYVSVWAKLVYCLIVVLVIFFILYQVKLRYLANQEILKHKLLEEANEAKLQFFINISHEIRTPMTLIISPLHKLISLDKNPERQKSYYLIERNAERILNLINQLMDTRKIDKQQMKLRFSEIELVGFIKDIYDIFSYQADCKGVKLNVLSDSDRLYVWIDPNNFDKVIMNLLSNSFKHVPDNGRINIYIKSGTDNNIEYPLNNYVEIIIEDNGTGIKESEISHVFDRFYQIADDESCCKGTGIGLHLAKSLVNLHHGTISVKNNEGKPGCSFIIRIPLGNAHLTENEMVNCNYEFVRKVRENVNPCIGDSSGENSNKKNVRKKYSVLIAEDDDEIRDYLVSELNVLYKIIACRNGKEAYDAIMSNTPDIVLSDVVMPEMDGISLLRRVKQNIKTNHVPVVLLTAKNTETDNIEGLSYGADAYLTKPFNIDIVKITVENILKNREVLRNNFSGNQEQESNMVYIKPESSDDKLMKRIMKAINDNISNPEMNVEMIATEVGISRVHLYRKLKELTNQSTRDFIRNTRLRQAEALLLSDKNYNVSEISLLVGFSNATYFSNAFKELYGVSPSKYMEMHKGNVDENT